MTISELVDVKVYCHTGVFTNKKNICLAVAGFGGITILVIGILGYAKTLPGILPHYTYVLMAAGGTLVLIDCIILVVLVLKHHKEKKPMDRYLQIQSEKNASWWVNLFKNNFNIDANSKIKRYTDFYCPQNENHRAIYCIVKKKEKSRCVHLYFNQDFQTQKLIHLKKTNYQYKDWNNSK